MVNRLGMQFICYDERDILLGTFADADGVKEICDLLNNLHDNNRMLSMKISEVSTKYLLLNEFSEDTNPNEAVETVLHELMVITKDYR